MNAKKLNFVTNPKITAMDIQLEKSLFLKRFEEVSDIDLIKALNNLLDFALPKQKEKEAEEVDEIGEIPEFHKRILAERMVDMEENPDDVMSWDEAYQEISARL